jgi:hypothetical protein
MTIPGFCAEASLKIAIRVIHWSSNDQPDADQTEVLDIAPAFWRSCLQTRIECEKDDLNMWIPDSRLRCGGFCAFG